jgi:hypothetical protein
LLLSFLAIERVVYFLADRVFSWLRGLATEPFTCDSLALFLVGKSEREVSEMRGFLDVRLELSGAQLPSPLLA